MNPLTKKPAADPRSPSQQEADEAGAKGQWDGFETQDLVSEEGALQILEQRRRQAEGGNLNHGATSGGLRNQPFRWREKVFRILRCDYAEGQAIVEVAPADTEFIAEVKKRVEQDRFHTLAYYQGFGFICFPEDYQKYQS